MQTGDERNSHFMYYMRSLLKQLQSLFPDCLATMAVSEKISADNSPQASQDLVEKWRSYMGTPETIQAIREKNVSVVLENNNPIMSMLQIKQKYQDPRLSENSRRVLWQFIEKLHNLAMETSPNERDTSLTLRLPPPPESPANSVNVAPLNIPPEMTPLIELAKSFIQKMPEDELDHMYGSIASISQNVLKSYEGQLPPEFGGDYFAQVLRQTFSRAGH